MYLAFTAIVCILSLTYDLGQWLARIAVGLILSIGAVGISVAPRHGAQHLAVVAREIGLAI